MYSYAMRIALFSLGLALVPNVFADADGIDRGDKINARLDARGERINDRLDERAATAAAAGHEHRAQHLDARGDRIEGRLDRRGDRIDNRSDHRHGRTH